MVEGAGYSGTPLAKKLGVKPGQSVLLALAPMGFEKTLGELPADSRVTRSTAGKNSFDVIVLFVRSAKELERRFSAAKKRLVENGGLWVAWPKKSSGVATDLDENAIRAHGLADGLVDNKVCAIDETWSGLRFVVRLRDRKQN